MARSLGEYDEEACQVAKFMYNVLYDRYGSLEDTVIMAGLVILIGVMLRTHKDTGNDFIEETLIKIRNEVTI